MSVVQQQDYNPSVILMFEEEEEKNEIHDLNAGSRTGLIVTNPVKTDENGNEDPEDFWPKAQRPSNFTMTPNSKKLLFTPTPDTKNSTNFSNFQLIEEEEEEKDDFPFEDSNAAPKLQHTLMDLSPMKTPTSKQSESYDTIKSLKSIKTPDKISSKSAIVRQSRKEEVNLFSDGMTPALKKARSKADEIQIPNISPYKPSSSNQSTPLKVSTSPSQSKMQASNAPKFTDISTTPIKTNINQSPSSKSDIKQNTTNQVQSSNNPINDSSKINKSNFISFIDNSKKKKFTPPTEQNRLEETDQIDSNLNRVFNNRINQSSYYSQQDFNRNQSNYTSRLNQKSFEDDIQKSNAIPMHLHSDSDDDVNENNSYKKLFTQGSYNSNNKSFKFRNRHNINDSAFKTSSSDDDYNPNYYKNEKNKNTRANTNLNIPNNIEFDQKNDYKKFEKYFKNPKSSKDNITINNRFNKINSVIMNDENDYFNNYKPRPISISSPSNETNTRNDTPFPINQNNNNTKRSRKRFARLRSNNLNESIHISSSSSSMSSSDDETIYDTKIDTKKYDNIYKNIPYKTNDDDEQDEDEEKQHNNHFANENNNEQNNNGKFFPSFNINNNEIVKQKSLKRLHRNENVYSNNIPKKQSRNKKNSSDSDYDMDGFNFTPPSEQNRLNEQDDNDENYQDTKSKKQLNSKHQTFFNHINHTQQEQIQSLQQFQQFQQEQLQPQQQFGQQQFHNPPYQQFNQQFPQDQPRPYQQFTQQQFQQFPNAFQQQFNQQFPQEQPQQQFNQQFPPQQLQPQQQFQNSSQQQFNQPFPQDQSQQQFNQPFLQDQSQQQFNQPFPQDQSQQQFNQPFLQDQSQQQFNQQFPQDQSQQQFNQPFSQNQPQQQFNQQLPQQTQPQQQFQNSSQQQFNQQLPQSQPQQQFNQQLPQDQSQPQPQSNQQEQPPLQPQIEQQQNPPQQQFQQDDTEIQFQDESDQQDQIEQNPDNEVNFEDQNQENNKKEIKLERYSETQVSEAPEFKPPTPRHSQFKFSVIDSSPKINKYQYSPANDRKEDSNQYYNLPNTKRETEKYSKTTTKRIPRGPDSIKSGIFNFDIEKTYPKAPDDKNSEIDSDDQSENTTNQSIGSELLSQIKTPKSILKKRNENSGSNNESFTTPVKKLRIERPEKSSNIPHLPISPAPDVNKPMTPLPAKIKQQEEESSDEILFQDTYINQSILNNEEFRYEDDINNYSTEYPFNSYSTPPRKKLSLEEMEQNSIKKVRHKHHRHHSQQDENQQREEEEERQRKILEEEEAERKRQEDEERLKKEEEEAMIKQLEEEEAKRKREEEERIKLNQEEEESRRKQEERQKQIREKEEMLMKKEEEMFKQQEERIRLLDERLRRKEEELKQEEEKQKLINQEQEQKLMNQEQEQKLMNQQQEQKLMNQEQHEEEQPQQQQADSNTKKRRKKRHSEHSQNDEISHAENETTESAPLSFEEMHNISFPDYPSNSQNNTTPSSLDQQTSDEAQSCVVDVSSFQHSNSPSPPPLPPENDDSEPPILPSSSSFNSDDDQSIIQQQTMPPLSPLNLTEEEEKTTTTTKTTKTKQGTKRKFQKIKTTTTTKNKNETSYDPKTDDLPIALRRTLRPKTQPLRHWMNEKIIYKPAENGCLTQYAIQTGLQNSDYIDPLSPSSAEAIENIIQESQRLKKEKSQKKNSMSLKNDSEVIPKRIIPGIESPSSSTISFKGIEKRTMKSNEVEILPEKSLELDAKQKKIMVVFSGGKAAQIEYKNGKKWKIRAGGQAYICKGDSAVVSNLSNDESVHLFIIYN